MKSIASNEKHLYIAKAKDWAHVKIGIACDAATRLRQLPEAVDLVSSMYAECKKGHARRIEQAIHVMFAEHKVAKDRGDGYTEWFNLSVLNELVSFLESPYGQRLGLSELRSVASLLPQPRVVPTPPPGACKAEGINTAKQKSAEEKALAAQRWREQESKYLASQVDRANDTLAVFETLLISKCKGKFCRPGFRDQLFFSDGAVVDNFRLGRIECLDDIALRYGGRFSRVALVGCVSSFPNIGVFVSMTRDAYEPNDSLSGPPWDESNRLKRHVADILDRVRIISASRYSKVGKALKEVQEYRMFS
jgi:T5orf172 domain